MFRILATLAFAAAFDLLVTNGKYTNAVCQMAAVVLQHFRVL
ncbi:MAG TPA: hypothetical protein VGF02_12090 [Pseudolabrys sp.]